MAVLNLALGHRKTGRKHDPLWKTGREHHPLWKTGREHGALWKIGGTGSISA